MFCVNSSQHIIMEDTHSPWGGSPTPRALGIFAPRRYGDTCVTPNGELVSGNAALVREAMALCHGL